MFLFSLFVSLNVPQMCHIHLFTLYNVIFAVHLPEETNFSLPLCLLAALFQLYNHAVNLGQLLNIEQRNLA